MKYLNTILFTAVLINFSFGQNTCSGLYFDGEDDRVLIPYISEYNIGEGDFTMEAWVNSVREERRIPAILSNRVPGGDFTGYHFTIHRWLAGNNTYYTGNIFMRIADENYYFFVEAVPTVQDGEFHHVAITRENKDSSALLSIYNDGLLVDVLEVDAGKNTNTGSTLVIGYDYANPANTGFEGFIRDVKLWNVAKTAERGILEDYYLEPDLTDSTLLGYWKLDEGEGQLVKDYSLYANDGKLGETDLNEDIDPIWGQVDDFLCYAPIIDKTGKELLCPQEKVTFLVDGDVDYRWWLASNPDKIISEEKTLTLTIDQEDTLFVEGSRGIKDTLQLSLASFDFCDKTITIFDFITPNNDGLNDFFEVENLEKYISNELWIFNRWGQQIYYQENYANDWQTGIKGTYFYLLKIKEKEYEGSIMVK